MKLYEKEKENLKIYTLEAKKEVLKKYREKLIMKQYEKQDLFYKTTSSAKENISKLYEYEINDCNFNVMRYGIYGLDCYFCHDLCSNMKEGFFDEKFLIQQALIDKYVNGELSKLPLTIINSSISIYDKYNFLKPTVMKRDIDGENNSSNMYYIENLMNLPIQLANLSFLEQEQFCFINLDYVDDLLNLFKLEEVENKDFDEFMLNLTKTDIYNFYTRNLNGGKPLVDKVKKLGIIKA